MLKMCYLGQHKRWNKKKFDIGLDKGGHYIHTLKTELIYHEVYETKAQANRAIFEYIEVYYNRERMHSVNGNLSPVEFEEKMMLHYETAAQNIL